MLSINHIVQRKQSICSHNSHKIWIFNFQKIRLGNYRNKLHLPKNNLTYTPNIAAYELLNFKKILEKLLSILIKYFFNLLVFQKFLYIFNIHWYKLASNPQLDLFHIHSHIIHKNLDLSSKYNNLVSMKCTSKRNLLNILKNKIRTPLLVDLNNRNMISGNQVADNCSHLKCTPYPIPQDRMCIYWEFLNNCHMIQNKVNKY